MINTDAITKPLAVVTGVMATVTGGYTLSEKFGLFKKPILEWSADHFSISSGPANGSFDVVVARKKFRDDCSVEGFDLEVRDARFIVHKAASSIAKFSGPASKDIDKFGFVITLEDPEKVAPGVATLLAHIRYKCPEGEIIINYPKHNNLNFQITRG